MAFADIGQVPEINNELILFRELFNVESKFYNSLLISQAGRIAQHLVEFLANQKGLIRDYDVYNRPFKDLLDKCNCIPDIVRYFIITIYNYRKDVDYSLKYEKKLNDKMLSFFKSFIDLLNWFENYFLYEFYNNRDMEFKEIEETKKLLIKQIKSPNNKLNDSQMERTRDVRESIPIHQHTSNGTYVIVVNEGDMVDFGSFVGSIIDDRLEENNKKQFKYMDKKTEEVMDNSNKNADRIIDEIHKLGEELKEVNKSLATRRKKTQSRLETAKDNEDRQEKIYNEFNHKSAEEFKNRVDDCIDKSSDEYNRVVNDLEDKFAISWYQLDERSRKYIITSELTYCSLSRFVENTDDIDFSGVCLSVTKALELELKKRFFDDFLKYLDSSDYDYPEYHSFLCSYNKKKKKYFVIREKEKTLGKIPHVLGSSKRSKDIDSEIRDNNISKLVEYSKDALFFEDNYNDDEIEAMLMGYGSEINSITDKYRNTAAHVDSIEQKKAKKCLNYVIDVHKFLITMLNSFDKEKQKYIDEMDK